MPKKGFRQALQTGGCSVIAEIKRRSPSAGILAPDLDVADLARRYQEGGAACLSVLTDEVHFGGSAEDLRQAQAASGLPVLRKDFLTDFEDIKASQAMGADALLLIVADIKPRLLAPLHAAAFEFGFDVLTEICDKRELAAALAAGANMIAVNQRANPKGQEFSVDTAKAVRLAPVLSGLPDIVKVAASGIGVKGGTSVEALAAAGYDAVLVGEALVSAADPASKLRSLVTAGRTARPRR